MTRCGWSVVRAGDGAGSNGEQKVRVAGEGLTDQIPPHPELPLWEEMKLGRGVLAEVI